MCLHVSVLVRAHWRTLPIWSAPHMLPGTANRHRWRWERRQPGRSEGPSQVVYTPTHTHMDWWKMWPLLKNVNTSLKRDIFRCSAAVTHKPPFLFFQHRDLKAFHSLPLSFYLLFSWGTTKTNHICFDMQSRVTNKIPSVNCRTLDY